MMKEAKRNRQGCLVTESWNVLEVTAREDKTEWVELVDTDYGWAVRFAYRDEYNHPQYSITQFAEDRCGPAAYAKAKAKYAEYVELLGDN